MSTSIIRNTTWAIDSAPSRLKLKVRTYRRARTATPFLAAEMALLAAVSLVAVRHVELLGMLPVIAASQFLFHIHDLDQSIVTSKLRDFVTKILECVGLSLLASVLVFWFSPLLSPGTTSIVAAALLAGLTPVLLRPALQFLVRRGKFVEVILIAGTGELAGQLYDALVDSKSAWRARKSRPIEFPNGAKGTSTVVDCEQLVQLTAQERISRVIVAERDAERRTQVAAALLDCRVRGLRVSDAVDFYEKLSGKIWLEGLYPQWLVYTDGFDRSRTTIYVKRFLDVLFSVLLLVATAPLLAVIALAIKLNSKGPVLFRQVRVGHYGKPFVLYKFRSMREDAEAETGPAWACESDGRVTTVGKVLRKFRLDEIPQAINVLRGEMSFVGPRPERPYFVEMLQEHIRFYDLRHCVKPGITGWAQIGYPYGASIEDAYEKLQYDLYYAKHMSLGCDAEILLKTLRIVLFGRGR